MATDKSTLIELVGPGGRTRLVSPKMWSNRVTRQSILDHGWKLKEDAEGVFPMPFPMLSQAPPNEPPAVEVESAPLAVETESAEAPVEQEPKGKKEKKEKKETQE